MQSRLAFLVLFMSPWILMAQEFVPSFRWSGDLRVRSEVDMRDFRNTTPGNTYTLLRTRLGFEALPAENVRVFVQARDSRVFGQVKDAGGSFNTLGDSRNLDLHQGYVEITQLFLDDLTLRLGRQELLYGNERMIGPVGWHNMGRSFDGGLFRISLSSTKVDVFAMNTGEVQLYTPVATPNAVRPVEDSGSDFYGVYGTTTGIANHRIDGYVLYQTNRESAELERATLGSYLKGRTGDLEYEAELAYQLGKRRSIDVSAYMATGMLTYGFKDCALSQVGIGLEVLSGTATGDAKFKSFEPLYATAHKFHGFMDYFINIPAHTANQGLMDAIVRATVKWSDMTSTAVWLHNFSLMREVAGASALGQEIDLVTFVRYNRNVSFEVGISSFIPARLMRDRFAGSDAAYWGYLTTSVSF